MTERMVQVPVSLIERLLGNRTTDTWNELRALLAQPTPTAGAAAESGRRWAEGVYAVNFQPGHYPSIVMPDVDGWDLLHEDGTWYNPSEGDTLHRLDPSTIRDVREPEQ